MPAIYLDHHASTPVDPRVLEAMRPYLGAACGNPSSPHSDGLSANSACDRARSEVARLLGGRPDEIIFTSGATESNNLAILGTLARRAGRSSRIVTSAVEHPSVREPARALSSWSGLTVVTLPVDRGGIVRLADAERAIGQGADLVTVQLANNEIGSIQPIEELGRMARAAGALLHVDATQGLGKVPFDVSRSGVSLVSLSGHKIHGPKGIGALWVKKGTQIDPILYGGEQEHGLRPGTHNVPGIVGLGSACAILSGEGTKEAEHLAHLRDELFERLLALVPGIVLNGYLEGYNVQAPRPGMRVRLTNNLNLQIPGLRGKEVCEALKGRVSFSTGSACSCKKPTPSAVLKAAGLSDEEALSSVRFGVGRFNRREEIRTAAEEVARAVRSLRGRSSVAA